MDLATVLEPLTPQEMPATSQGATERWDHGLGWQALAPWIVSSFDRKAGAPFELVRSLVVCLGL